MDFEEDSAPHLKQSESAMDDHVLEVLVDEVSNTEPASHHLEDLLDEVPSSTEQACDPVNVCVELALDRRTPTSEGGSSQVASLIALPTLVLLSLLNWSLLLKHLPDWRWDPSRGLVCPNGNILPSRGIPDITAESLTVRFRARAGTCDKCPLRSSCSTSRQAKFRKELGWKLPLSSLGMDISSEHVPDTPFPEEFPIWTKPNSLPKVAGRITGPHFIPSEFRKAHREAAADLEVWVELALPADLRKPVWRVDDDAARQHRRNTWGRRRLANSLPANATLKVQYQMSDPDKKWISSITGSGA